MRASSSRARASSARASMRDGALPGRRQKFFHAHDPCGVLREPEPLQSGERQDRRVDFAVIELAQPRLHIAAQRHDAQVAAAARLAIA